MKSIAFIEFGLLYFFTEELEEILSQHFGSQCASQREVDVSDDGEYGDSDGEVERDGSVIESVIEERAHCLASQLSLHHTEDDSSSSDEDCEVRNTDKERVKQFLVSGCMCAKKCHTKLTFEDIYNNRLHMRELESESRDMLIMGLLQKEASKCTSTTTHGTSRKRAPPKDLRFHGIKVCLGTFLVCYGISKNYLYALCNHVKSKGVVPRTHGNTRKMPHNAFTFSEVKQVVEFIKNQADETGLPQPAAPRGRDNIPPVFLPSDFTKKELHDQYTQACTEVGSRCVSLTVFKNVWSNCVPHIKIASPREDVCASCEKMRVKVMDARSEVEKLEATDALREHILLAQQERELYNECVKRSKEDPSYSHYTFDFSQNVALPHTARQMGPLYFLSLRKIQLFGFRIDGHPRQLNFLIDEHETIGADGKETHGPNAVISMVDWALQTYGNNRPNFTIHADNCPGQNKNKFMLGYFMWRVMTGQSSTVEYLMQIPGHARCHVDAGFASIKKLYRRTDCETIGQLEEVINRSCMANLAVRYPQWQWRNWKVFLGATFKPLKNIRKYHYFRFSSEEQGVVIVRRHRYTEEERINILKEPGFRYNSVARPEVLTPPGLSQARQTYLYSQVRPYVRPALQDEFCEVP